MSSSYKVTDPATKEKTNFGRDLFSIQLEITEKLLEAEEKKLRVLKAEIEASRHSDAPKDPSKVKELEQQEANFVRIKMQQQRLAQEMQDAAVAGIIQKKPKMKASRSLPPMVFKTAPKTRPSVFDHLVPQTTHSKTSSSKNVALSPLNGTVAAPGQYSDELVYRDGVLVAGSLDALIDLLIPTATHYPERSYVFAFILCSRLFLRPHELLSRVARVFQLRQKQQQQQQQGFRAEDVEVTATRIVQLMEEWTETFPYDFRDERMMRSLKEMTQACASVSTELRKSVGQVQSVLVKRLSVLDKYEHILAQVNAVAMERLIDPKTQVNIQLVCADPVTLAQQLTHIELERLNNIGPEEFIQTFVKHPSEVEPLYRDMKKTCNIEAYVEWFNRLSYLVATEICVADKKRNRAKLIEFFADTANECRKLHNFNSYMAISAGLFMSPVTRLRRTRAKVSSSKIHSIEEFVDPISNFSTYRMALEKAIGQADKETDSWVVPFFSLIVKDIYFLHQGMSDRDVKGFIRFEKCFSLARLVSQILSYKDRVLPFPRVRNILNYLMTIPVHTDDELQLASYEIEVPEHPGEKKRYQELKTLLGSFGGRISRPTSTSSVSSTSPPLSPTFPTIREEV